MGSSAAAAVAPRGAAGHCVKTALCDASGHPRSSGAVGARVGGSENSRASDQPCAPDGGVSGGSPSRARPCAPPPPPPCASPVSGRSTSVSVCSDASAAVRPAASRRRDTRTPRE